jgi:hypothetical protein
MEAMNINAQEQKQPTMRGMATSPDEKKYDKVSD